MVFGAVHMQRRALQDLDCNFHWIRGGAFIGAAFDDFVGARTMATIANEMTTLADGGGGNMSSAQGADSVRGVSKVCQRSTADQTAGGLVDDGKHVLVNAGLTSASSARDQPSL